jgi:hypothetical protein
MTQAVALAQQASTGVSQGFKNRIINGAMVIDQRNAGAQLSAAQVANFAYITDRNYIFGNQSNKFSGGQNAGSVTPPAGFVNYSGVTSASSYSVLSSDYFWFGQKIEGYNIADLNWGSVNAKTITLSFWVRSSLTGTFGGSLQNNDQSRSYPFTYTISAANTWTQISVTIAGDTSGTWLTTNGIGVLVNFGMGSGATYSGTANTWQSGLYIQPTGTVSVVGTNGATFYITGIQFEVGSTATSFEYLDYGRSLIQCQRYFEKCQDMSAVPGSTTNPGLQYLLVCAAGATANYGNTVSYQVRKRATPTFTYWDTGGTVNKVSFDIGGGGQNVTTAFNGETRILVYAASVSNPGAIALFWSASAEL